MNKCKYEHIVDCRGNTNDCANCLYNQLMSSAFEIGNHKAEIAELKEKLNKYLLISDHEKIIKVIHQTYKQALAEKNQKITRRNKQIADLSSKIVNLKADNKDLETQVQKLLANGARF